jgi:phospholipid transport system transporter-binding protein
MKLPPRATLEKAAELAASIPDAINGGQGTLCVDASELRDFDSSTIALLLQAHRLAHAAGRAFVVSGAPPQLAELARLYGVDKLLSLSDASMADSSPRAATT